MFRDGGDAPKTAAEVMAMQGYGGSDDWIVMPLQCVTQWDSLAHVFYEGKMYNGYDAALVTSSGAAKNSIDKTKSKIAGRGVLLDVRAVQRRARARAGLRHHRRRSRGDRRRRSGSRCCPATSSWSAPATCRRYLDKQRLAALRSRPFARRVRAHRALAARASRSPPSPRDNYAVEVRPSEIAGFRSPSTSCAIPNMGLTLGEIFFLEELAADCAADGRYAFLLVAPPLPVTARSARRSTRTR